MVIILLLLPSHRMGTSDFFLRLSAFNVYSIAETCLETLGVLSLVDSLVS